MSANKRVDFEIDPELLEELDYTWRIQGLPTRSAAIRLLIDGYCESGLEKMELVRQIAELRAEVARLKGPDAPQYTRIATLTGLIGQLQDENKAMRIALRVGDDARHLEVSDGE